VTNDTQQALAAIVGGAAAQDSPDSNPIVIPGDAAIPITRSGCYVLTKGSAAALTIAAPTVPGITIRIISDTAFAHVLTFTGNTLRGGTAAVATWTAAAQKGSGCTIMSLSPTEAAWGLASNVAGALA
jgi:hypothetical protein